MSVTVVAFAGVVVFVIVLVVALLFLFSSWSSLSRFMLTNFPQYCEYVFFFFTYPLLGLDLQLSRVVFNSCTFCFF